MAQNVRTGFSWLGIVLRFPKNPRLLSASKIGVHQTTISFSGPSKNTTLSLVQIHAPNERFQGKSCSINNYFRLMKSINK